MKQGCRFISLLLALLLLTGCAKSNTNAPDSSGASVQQALAEISALGKSPDDNYRTWYELFVYSFCDSNGDGIGDLPGVLSKLDYLQELGITGIWFMPIHPSKSYHKYNVADYYAIDPAYGTMEDMDALLAECEKRDIHVILDLVLNHTGDDHLWFTTAVDYLQALPQGQEPDSSQCPYVDYYNFTREPATGYHQVSGTDWYYECQFSPDTPDLNWGCQALRHDIRDVMDFWLSKGVSGFRLDAAKEFYSGKVSDNMEVLSWIETTAKELKPDVYLVAEVWEGFAQVAEYYGSGITSLFDFPFANSDGKIIKVLQGAGNASVISTYATALEKADKAYAAANPDYIDAPFLSNHDIGRIAGFVGRNESKTKLAGAMNLFMSGSAFIYYGEEIGMIGAGNDPSKRAPMVWNSDGSDGTTPPPDCEIPESYPFGSLADQRDDPDSIYSYYRQAIAIRQAIPAIARGKTTAEVPLNTGCVSAFRKTWGEESCIILMNISEDTAEADLTSYEDWSLSATLSVQREEISRNDHTLTLPPYGTAVLTRG